MKAPRRLASFRTAFMTGASSATRRAAPWHQWSSHMSQTTNAVFRASQRASFVDTPSSFRERKWSTRTSPREGSSIVEHPTCAARMIQRPRFMDSPSGDRDIVDEDKLLAVAFLGRGRHLRERLAVRPDEPCAARPAAVGRVSRWRIELGMGGAGLVVDGGGDLELRNPAVRLRPWSAELVPPGDRPAGRVRVRPIDDPRAAVGEHLEIFLERTLGTDRDPHLRPFDREDFVRGADFHESLFLREIGLVMRDDDLALGIDHDLGVPLLSVAILLGQPGADVHALLGRFVAKHLHFRAVEAEPAHRGAEVIAVDGKLGETDELRPLVYGAIAEINIAVPVRLDLGLARLRVGPGGGHAPGRDERHLQMARVFVDRFRFL